MATAAIAVFAAAPGAIAGRGVDALRGLELASDREQVAGGIEADGEFAAEDRDARDGLLEVRGEAPVADLLDAADVERGVRPEPEPGAEPLARFECGGARSRRP